MEKYYLYRHIRHDKNEPFYIGVGNIVKDTEKDSIKYKRAYSKVGRNQFWKRIVNKTVYSVEILLISDNKDFILIKEVEFIKLYGRRDKKSGTLCNLTDGGEVFPEKCTANFGSNNPVSVKIDQFDENGNFIKTWVSYKEAAEIINTSPENIGRAVNNNRKLDLKLSNIYSKSKNYIFIDSQNSPFIKLKVNKKEKSKGYFRTKRVFELYYRNIMINKQFFNKEDVYLYIKNILNLNISKNAVNISSAQKIKDIEIINKKQKVFYKYTRKNNGIHNNKH